MEPAKGGLQEKFKAMYEELRQWRAAHPEASLDEIAAQVSPRRRDLMGALLMELALQHGDGAVPEGFVCERCGRALSYKGCAEREVIQLEGEGELTRAYYYCAHCEGGVFPPGSEVEAGAAQLDAGDDPGGGASGGGDSLLSSGGRELGGSDQDAVVQE